MEDEKLKMLTKFRDLKNKSPNICMNHDANISIEVMEYEYELHLHNNNKRKLIHELDNFKIYGVKFNDDEKYSYESSFDQLKSLHQMKSEQYQLLLHFVKYILNNP